MTIERAAVAYLRRSSADDANPGEDSRGRQLSAVQRLCGADVVIYEDWGKSGSGDGSKRPEYQRLKAEIAAGLIGSICAESLTRLGRNTRELLDLLKLCETHGVQVQTDKERVDTSGAMGRFMFTVMAAIGELELDMGRERTAGSRTARKARHDAAGLATPASRPMYGMRHVTTDGLTRAEPDPDRPIEPVLAAYAEAGSIRRACELLQTRGIPAPGGGDVWATFSLRRILDHWAALGRVELPAIMSRKAGRRPVKASAVLSGILRCHCGRTMTPNVRHGQYYCAGGRDSGVAIHGRITVTERSLLAVLRPEAERYTRQTKISHTETVRDQRAIDKLTVKRERITDGYVNGLLTAARAKAETDAIDAQLAELEAQTKRGLLLWNETIPEWTDVPATNRHLRRLWAGVQLDASMTPTVTWGIPGYMYEGYEE